MSSTPIEQFDVPRGTGKAFVVDKGRLVRLVQLEPGGQVVDLQVFNRHNPDERFWSGHTAMEYGSNISVGALLLSSGPWEEPLLSVVADSLPRDPTPRGARYHDVLLSCCSRKSRKRRYGEDNPGCHDAIFEAVAPYGIPQHHVNDTFNAFMRTGFENGLPFHEPSEAKPGDYVELRSEKDVIIAISTCRGGSSQQDSRGIRIEIR